MAMIYVRLIQAGAKTIEQVPAKLRADVQAILDELNPPTTQTELDAE